jgi:hypothetical protein
MPATAIRTVLRPLVGLAAVFAMAVSAGCSSASPDSSSTISKHLTGTMSDWTSAVCEPGRGPQLLPHGRYMGGATNPMECFATMQRANGGRMGPVPILIGNYTSESLMENDLGRLGAYAKGNDGTEYVVFASIPTSGPALAAESAMFLPLRSYGFEISPSPN